MKDTNTNPYDIIALAKRVHGKSGFEIYLVVDGKGVHLLHHDACAPLFRLLKNGMDIEELRQVAYICRCERAKSGNAARSRLARSVERLLEATDSYVDRLAYLDALAASYEKASPLTSEYGNTAGFRDRPLAA